MPSKITFVRQETNWFAFIPKLILLAVLCVCFYPLDKREYVVFAVFVFFVITLAARWAFLTEDLHQSIKHIRNAAFAEAIPFIEKSFDYYTQRAWIDKYRFALQISSSKSTFREICIGNLAYCYVRLGEPLKAKALYEALLREYPANKNAKLMLDDIKTILEKLRALREYPVDTK